MTGKELVEKILSAGCEFASEEIVDAARAAFFANLTEALKVEFPEGIWRNDDTMRMKLLFYSGAVTALDLPITEEAIRSAHLAMILPSNRAIISRLLYGQTKVDHFGVPASYGTAHH